MTNHHHNQNQLDNMTLTKAEGQYKIKVLTNYHGPRI